MMNRRDFLRSFALTGGLWVLGESAGRTCAAAGKGTAEWPNHPFLQGNFEDDDVVLLTCRIKQYPEAIGFQPRTSAHSTDGKARAATNAPFLYHWRCNLKTGRATEGPLDGTPTEFPRVNEALTGKRTRFGYCGRSSGAICDGLIKYDLDTGTSEHHVYGQGRRVGVSCRMSSRICRPWRKPLRRWSEGPSPINCCARLRRSPD